ncbi:MAG: alpha/beta fold hydrolase [Planctomycetota bacterium]
MPSARTTRQERLHLSYDNEPGRRIGVRIERPPETVSTPATGHASVVLCHGFKGFMDWGFFPWLSAELSSAGFVVVSLNASGCGVGDNPLEMDDEEAFFRDTYSRQLEDIARVRRFAAELEDVDADRIALLGHSRGGGMAVVSAAESPSAALVTWAAIDEADRFSESIKAAWREDGELCVPNGRTGQIHRLSVAALHDFETNAERLDIRAAAARLQEPYLAIHGRKDPTVDWVSADRLAAQAPRGKALIIEDADHGFGATHPLGESRPASLLEAFNATLSHLAPLLHLK